MIVHPEERVADFAKAGSDIISIHAEPAATVHLDRTVNQVTVPSHCLIPCCKNPVGHRPICFTAQLYLSWVIGILEANCRLYALGTGYLAQQASLCPSLLTTAKHFCKETQKEQIIMATCIHGIECRVQIKDLGVKAGVVLNPATPLESIQHVLHQVDLILLMSGEPLPCHCRCYCSCLSPRAAFGYRSCRYDAYRRTLIVSFLSVPVVSGNKTALMLPPVCEQCMGLAA